VKIGREDVLRIAELAHLGLSPEEVEKFQGQLDGILTYIEKLNQLDVNQVEPMSQVVFAPAAGEDHHPELREDVLRSCDVSVPILAQAPDAEAPFFRVPKVIDR
jgi:aspartyl-tRNA(Asn)/glutamyl-tRNA(Gln) amidotransferase subunit C